MQEYDHDERTSDEPRRSIAQIIGLRGTIWIVGLLLATLAGVLIQKSVFDQAKNDTPTPSATPTPTASAPTAKPTGS
ncbi:MAG: hypothetical protein WBB44_09215 [Candidatus Nanopelagicales bacterium]|nr:hypothetical protein [Candidatus Nanopelagicales bacterium]